jgi:hypothetical protein
VSGRIVYAVPSIPAAPFEDPWPGITQMWIGPDGSEWALGGKSAQGIHLKPGVRGRTMPDGQHTIDAPAGIEGGVWRGWRADPREVFWPLSVWKDGGSQAWLDYDAAFAASFDPERPGTWVVIQPNGTRRELTCRFVSDGGGAGDFAPGVRGYASYGITMVAEQPYWRGEPVVRWFTPAAAAADFLPANPGDPYIIGEGSTAATARVSNLGDRDAWPTWWANDTTSLVAGVGALTVDVPFVVAADKLLVVDTGPTERTAIEIDMFPSTTPTMEPAAQEQWVADRLPSGTDRTLELGATTKWGAIPPGKSVDLSVAIVGDGLVRVSFRPAHRRAW